VGTVDGVAQRNATAAEELSSTAEEVSAQAISLQELVAFFQLADARAAVARPPVRRPVERERPLAPRLPSPAALLAAVPAGTSGTYHRGNGSSGPANGGYHRF